MFRIHVIQLFVIQKDEFSMMRWHQWTFLLRMKLWLKKNLIMRNSLCLLCSNTNNNYVLGSFCYLLRFYVKSILCLKTWKKYSVKTIIKLCTYYMYTVLHIKCDHHEFYGKSTFFPWNQRFCKRSYWKDDFTKFFFVWCIVEVVE